MTVDELKARRKELLAQKKELCDGGSEALFMVEEELMDVNAHLRALTPGQRIGSKGGRVQVGLATDHQQFTDWAQEDQAGCVYDFSVSNGATIVTEDSASLTSLSQRIHKDEIEVVELQQSIIYLDWDAVIRDGSDYQLYIPKSDTYTLSADSAFCLLEGYAEWVTSTHFLYILFRIGAFRQNRNDILNREIPFFLFFIPCGAYFSIFKKLDGIIFVHALQPP